LKSAFLVGAIAMIISFLLISTLPEVSLEVAPEKKEEAVAKA
jgi:hypothetical protein